MTLNCCTDMVEAQKRGTDNEGYEELCLWLEAFDPTDPHPLPVDEKLRKYPGYYIGNPERLSRIRLCPWCGTPVAGADT